MKLTGSVVSYLVAERQSCCRASNDEAMGCTQMMIQVVLVAVQAARVVQVVRGVQICPPA